MVKFNPACFILATLTGSLWKARMYKSRRKHVRATDKAEVMEIVIWKDIMMKINISQTWPSFIAFTMVYIIGFTVCVTVVFRIQLRVGPILLFCTLEISS